MYEKEANEKHERLAEMKIEYNMQIKLATDEEEKERLQEERDRKLNILKQDLEFKKTIKVKEMKRRH